MFKVGIIRVLTTENEDLLNAHGKIIEKVFPQLTVDSRCIPNQPKGIYDLETEAIATPKIVELASRFAEEGFDAVIISCCADPAYSEVCNRIKIPVIGAGRAGAAMALGTGNKIGVLGITAEKPRNLTGLLGKSLVGYLRPESVTNTLDLLTKQGKKATVKTARKLIDLGADTILLGCTGMATAGLAPIIGKELGIKVIDPVVSSGFLAWYSSRREKMQEGVPTIE